MSNSARRHPSGNDAGGPAEQAPVRTRANSAIVPKVTPPALDEKVARAQSILASLPASDPRARLLAAAVLRRDEALIDAILNPGREQG